MSQTFVCKISMELQNTVFQLSRLVPDAYSSKQNVSSMHQSKGFQHVPKQNKTKQNTNQPKQQQKSPKIVFMQNNCLNVNL